MADFGVDADYGAGLPGLDNRRMVVVTVVSVVCKALVLAVNEMWKQGDRLQVSLATAVMRVRLSRQAMKVLLSLTVAFVGAWCLTILE